MTFSASNELHLLQIQKRFKKGVKNGPGNQEWYACFRERFNEG